jgi:hypothetical protein
LRSLPPRKEIDIKPSLRADARGHRPPYSRGEPVYDIAFENVQAGERTSHLFRLANAQGGFVVGTGDLSELALGWCTYGVGDHMSHYNVNASVPKTLVRHLVRWVARRGSLLSDDVDVLDDDPRHAHQPGARAGRRQQGAGAKQRGAGRPYELQDFHLYQILRYGYAPTKVAFLAWTAWHDAARATGPMPPTWLATPTRWPRSRSTFAPSAGASSRRASSSARPCRTRPRSAPAARCRRAATGARRATRRRRCGSPTSIGSRTRDGPSHISRSFSMKRIVLFVMTNLAVMLVLSIVLKVFGIDRYMAQDGINFGSLLAFSAVLGFGGAIVSLLISKQVAKWSTGAQVIDGSEGSTQAWLVQTVRRLAEQARIGMPTWRSSKVRPTPSPRVRSRTRRWWPSRPGSCSR